MYYTLNTHWGWFVWTLFTTTSKTHFVICCCQEVPGVFHQAWIQTLIQILSVENWNTVVRYLIFIGIVVVHQAQLWSRGVLSLLQSKVWNTPQRSGEEIWGAARSLDQFTTGVQESSGPVCWQSLTPSPSWPTGQFNEWSLICASATLDWIKSTCIFFLVTLNLFFMYIFSLVFFEGDLKGAVFVQKQHEHL